MKLTVDASIVVKWYISEKYSEEARLLLAHRLERHAPVILLAEFANTIWKRPAETKLPILEDISMNFRICVRWLFSTRTATSSNAPLKSRWK